MAWSEVSSARPALRCRRPKTCRDAEMPGSKLGLSTRPDDMEVFFWRSQPEHFHTYPTGKAAMNLIHANSASKKESLTTAVFESIMPTFYPFITSLAPWYRPSIKASCSFFVPRSCRIFGALHGGYHGRSHIAWCSDLELFPEHAPRWQPVNDEGGGIIQEWGCGAVTCSKTRNSCNSEAIVPEEIQQVLKGEY